MMMSNREEAEAEDPVALRTFITEILQDAGIVSELSWDASSVGLLLRGGYRSLAPERQDNCRVICVDHRRFN
jgi:hypothetical protein